MARVSQRKAFSFIYVNINMIPDMAISCNAIELIYFVDNFHTQVSPGQEEGRGDNPTSQE